MDKVIKIHDSQVPRLLSFFEKEQAELMETIQEERQKLAFLEQRYKDGQATINALKNGETSSQNALLFNGSVAPEYQVPSASYDKDASWWEKIKFLLNRNKRVLSANEIADFIYELEPALKNGSREELRRNGINIFSTLTNKFKNGELLRIKEDNEYKYGFLEWFDPSGFLKPEYDYDNQLIKTQFAE